MYCLYIYIVNPQSSYTVVSPWRYTSYPALYIAIHLSNSHYSSILLPLTASSQYVAPPSANIQLPLSSTARSSTSADSLPMVHRSSSLTFASPTAHCAQNTASSSTSRTKLTSPTLKPPTVSPKSPSSSVPSAMHMPSASQSAAKLLQLPTPLSPLFARYLPAPRAARTSSTSVSPIPLTSSMHMSPVTPESQSAS